MLIGLITATEFLFGQSTKVLETGESRERGEKFAECFSYATEVIGNKSLLGKLAAILPNKRFDDSIKFVHEYIQYYVSRTLEQQRTNPEKSDEGSSKYVFLEQLAKTTSSPKKIQDELINILLAGRDTTASLLSHLWCILARQPEVFEKLRAEVLHLEDREPSFEQIKDMKYLQYCLNETLRLYPTYGIPLSADLTNMSLSNPYS
jgi:cytochrome P450